MTTSAMRSFVARRGEDFVYTTFTEGARDAYEDIAYAADATPPTIRGIRSDSSGRTFLSQTGEVRAVDISLLVADPLVDSLGNAVVLQDDMTERAATLTDSSGRVYKMVGLGHEAAPVGAKRVLCVRQAD
jgi:hypothetical protein